MPFIAACKNCEFIVWGKDRNELVTRQDIHDHLKKHYNNESWFVEQYISPYEYDFCEKSKGETRRQIFERQKKHFYPNTRRNDLPTSLFSFHENKQLLDFLERLLIQERDNEKMRTLHDVAYGEVIELAEGTVTLSCTPSRFEEGDVIGYLELDHQIKPIGNVLGGGDILTVAVQKTPEFERGQKLTLCEAEVLIGYDLQLELLSRIRNGELNEPEKAGAKCVLEKVELLQLAIVKLLNNRDIKGNFCLDEYQASAVEAILGLQTGEPMLIIGPPGTGKTRVIGKAVQELWKRGERILVASHTNIAVDNVIELFRTYDVLRVGVPEKIMQHVRPYSLGYKARTNLGVQLRNLEEEIRSKKKEIHDSIIRLHELKELSNSGTANDFIENKKREILPRLQFAQALLRKLCESRNQMLTKESERLVRSARIIGSTLIKSQLQPLKSEVFDTVFIDECSQASISLALLGMVKAKKWVLVGDHKQLLPIFRCLKETSESFGLSRQLSAFCYLLQKYPSREKWLGRYYRGNDEIIGFAQKYVYQGKIAPAPECKNIKLSISTYPSNMPFLCPDKPVVFVHAEGAEVIERSGSIQPC